jgi:hypothetical protein
MISMVLSLTGLGTLLMCAQGMIAKMHMLAVDTSMRLE